MTGLQANKTYHVKTFAINSVGTSYGEELTFTTLEGLPVVVTSSVTEITATSAKCGGNVTDLGASNVTERGICWSTNHNPTIADSHVSGGSGAGTYTCSMTGLTPNATYYVRAYAKNTQGISYGTEVNFVALEGLPTVTTSAVTSITSTIANGGGNVTNQGASNVTERGICWGTEHNPAMNGSHASSGSGAGQFTAQMSGLTPGTKYYVRAYAKNTQGVTYGMEVEFTTSATMPTVTTGSVSEITQTTATGGGNVTSDGGSSVTERGICWSTSANPTIENSHIASGSGTGNFSVGMTGLTAGTTYHVRAYATNSAGTSYGNDVTFTTTATLPTVTTAQVSNITQTTAVGGGNVTADGGANVTERGVCWSLNADPTTSDSHATGGTGTGGFTANMTGLTANTTYHVRAYAKNSQGTSYGSDVTFTTSQSISAPTVTTSAVTMITQTTAVGGGNVTSDGGATVTERGICWGTTQNPTTSGTHSNSGTGIGDFTVQMNALTANTTYYVRAYAVNSAGTSYGNEVSFATQSSGGGSIGGHEYVDLGLPSGLLWATCNIGANTPEQYGDYYAWGETTTKSSYTHYSYKWYSGVNPSEYTKYNQWDNLTILEFFDDVARVYWGYSWRIPSYNEVSELKNQCTWIWTTQDGKNGYRITGPNNNSIFLPAAGCRYDNYLNGEGTSGRYWTNKIYYNSYQNAWDIDFTSSNYEISATDRYYGFSIRPVCFLQDVPVVTTSSVSNITNTSALCGGNVAFDGGTSVTARGVCWSTSQNPTTNDSYTSDGDGTGSFTSSITDLSENTVYYVRAYATNNAGTSYGEQKTFKAQYGSSSESIHGHEYVDLGLPSGLLWATCNVGANSPEEYGIYSQGNESAFGWDSPWGKPTLEQHQELIDNCTHTMTTINGINGYLFQGLNGNTLFLPAAGYGYNGYHDIGEKGWYWSSSRNYNMTEYYYYMVFDETSISTNCMFKSTGMTIRLVHPN